MAFSRARCQDGMNVVGTNGDNVGTVKECRESNFLVDRRMQRDVYVPYDAIQDITGDTITLNVSAEQVDNMGWASPPITGRAGGTEQGR